MSRRRFFVGAMGLVLCWCAFAFALEIYRSTWLALNDPWLAEQPSTWRLVSARVGELEKLTAHIERVVPAGSKVLMAGAEEVGNEAFFRFLWLAYLLPAHKVQPSEPPAADYKVTFDSQREASGMLIYSGEAGTVYRLKDR